MTTNKTDRTHPLAKAPPKDARDLILGAAAGGANKRGVALALGTSFETFSRWLADDPELQTAFDKGREIERQTLHNVLYKTATEGSGKDKLLAAMFLLKSRHGYREGEQEQQGNRVQITFNLPGAKKPEEFVEEVRP